MRERINALWWKARIGYNNQSCDPEVLEKFAELIVQDIHQYVDSMDTAQIISNGILKRYGVADNSIKVGGRIKVISGFNVGATGTVSYIEPTGRMWVMRDGASTDVFYTPDEVERIAE